MAYSSLAVANAFISRALNDPSSLPDLTPMKLQKLMYYAQAWFFARTGEPLLDDYFCRWQYGPVIPSIYHEFKEYGANAITEYGKNFHRNGNNLTLLKPEIPQEDSKAWFYVNQVIDRYGRFNAAELSAMTHSPTGAWALGGKRGDGSPITNNELKRDVTERTGA